MINQSWYSHVRSVFTPGWCLLMLLALLGGCSCSQDKENSPDTTQASNEEEAEKQEPQSADSEECDSSGDGQGGSSKDGSSKEGTESEAKNSSEKSSEAGSDGESQEEAAGNSSSISQKLSEMFKGNKKETSPRGAARSSRRLLNKAKDFANREEYAKATEAALKAWQMTSAHKKDQACQKLAKEAAGWINKYGRHATKASGLGFKHVPLIVE